LASEQQRKKAFFMMSASALAVALVSLAYLVVGRVSFDQRLAGIFNSPNYLAMYLSLGILSGLIFFDKKNRIHLGALIIVVVALYFTFSYAAWLALALSLAGVFIYQNTEIKKYLGVLILVLVLALALQSNSNKLGSLLRLDSRSSLASRVMIWTAAGKIAKDNWLWGIGPGNFQNKYLEYQKYFPPYLEWAVPHPHNLYLNFLLQAGLAGLMGFIWLIYIWSKKFWQSTQSPIKIASLGIVLYVLFHGLVDTTYFKNDLAVIFWLVILLLPEIKKIHPAAD
jgi:putative inorganic carbon (HCO3(-)) transporter